MNPAELFRQEADALKVAPGDVLFREGDKGDKLYVLLEGEMEILLGDFVLETARPGTLIGEMALIDDSPRTVEALKGAEGKRLKYRQPVGDEIA